MREHSQLSNYRPPVIITTVGVAILLGIANPGISDETPARQALGQSGFKGGLIVYLGDDRDTLRGLCEQGPESSLVLALSSDSSWVASVRQSLKERGSYGPVSVDTFDGGRLPLVEDLVNLLVVETPAAVDEAELLRVLTPRGVALIGKPGGGYKKLTKPAAVDTDDWTHYLHDATNNAVGHDKRVGPPRRVRWVGSPRWSRHHEHMSSMNALVSSGGRIFYVFDESPPLSNQFAPRWKLIARDAFNGVPLWKRTIQSWHNHRWPLKSGPAQLPRRLAAVDDTVFVTLSYQGPVEALDTVSGKTRRVFESTRGTEELLVSENVLFALVNREPVDFAKYTYDTSNAVCWVEKGNVAQRYPWNEKPRDIQALDVASGKLLWEARTPVMPMSMAVDGEKVYFNDGQKIVALDRSTGEKSWESPTVGRRKKIATCFGATLVIYDGVVLFTGGNGRMSAYSAESGERLWEDRQPPTGHNSPLDILAVGGLVWNGAIAGGRHDGIFRGRDPRTGKVVKEFPPDVDTYWFHHRCYRAKATDNYILASRTGVEFVDMKKETWDINHWVRGACVYGIMPSNGLLYAPQHPCICYAESKLNGFCALAPASKAESPKPKADDAPRLQHGQAYDEPASQLSAFNSQLSEGWPTYRHDAARSGAASTAVKAKLPQAWTAELGGRLSSVTVAGGHLYVASIDTHTVHALDAETGKSAWTFTAGGRVDSPPTFHRGRLLFGSADGHVYCLRAADGQLVWRYRAAPEDLRVMSFEQIESVWPVHGAVLVQDDVVFCTAGRSMFLDGGIHLLRLDVASGKKLSETILDETDPTTGDSLQAKTRDLNMPVALPDVLSCDGKYVYMRSQKFDLDGTRPVIPTPHDNPTLHPSNQLGDDVHLFCPTGMLDDSWFHRGYWMYGKTFSSGCNYWFRAGRFVPAGRLLVFDDETVYGYGRKPSLFVWTPVLEYHLFAARKHPTARAIERVVEANETMNKNKWAIMDRFISTAAPKEDISAVGLKWSGPDPDLLVRSMILCDGKLFVAGPPDLVDEERVFQNPFDAKAQDDLARQAAALEGASGALLHTIDATSGEKLSTLRLPAPPVWDSMAAADRRLYLATVDGRVMCFGGE